MAGKRKAPGFWFFVGDWMKDPELRFCSLFARGLLVDLLCLMFESNERGYLSKPDGTPRSNAQIVGAITGGELAEKLEALSELEVSGVLSRDERGVLYSRRIARLSEISDKRAAAGAIGGRAGPEQNGEQNGQQTGNKPASKQRSKTEARSEAKREAKTRQDRSKRGGVSDSDSVSVSDSFKEKKKARAQIPPGGFDRFWSVVHAKIGKAAATKAFDAAVRRVVAERKCLPTEAVDAIVEAMTRFARTPNANPPDRTAIHPTTWLNQGRYDDEDPGDAGGGISGNDDQRSSDDDQGFSREAIGKSEPRSRF